MLKAAARLGSTEPTALAGSAAVFQGRNHSFHRLQGTHFPRRSISHVHRRWQRLRRQNWQSYAEHAERMLVRRAHRQGRLLGLFVLVPQVDTVCASLVRSSWVKIVSRVPSGSTAEPPKLGCVLSLLSVGRSSFPWTISLPLRPWRSSGRQLPGARAR